MLQVAPERPNHDRKRPSMTWVELVLLTTPGNRETALDRDPSSKDATRTRS